MYLSVLLKVEGPLWLFCYQVVHMRLSQETEWIGL